MNKDDWKTFDALVEEHGTEQVYENGESVQHRIGPAKFIDTYGAPVEGDFGGFAKAVILSSNGIHGIAPTRGRVYSNPLKLMRAMVDHECQYGQLIRNDSPKHLACGWLCSQCGEAWEISLKKFKANPLPEFFADMTSPECRANVRSLIQEGYKIKYSTKVDKTPRITIKIRK